MVMATSNNCPFCQKLSNLSELPADEVVWEFPHSAALLGSWQYYHGYCVLVARRHATELSGLDSSERRAYLDEMCLVARAIEECFHPHKLNYELLGNQVPHLHWHIFPRYQHDPDLLRPVWLALDRAERDEQERQRLQAGPADRAATRATLQQKLQALASFPFAY
jgi:diadenosine tetraphosphate (Ap4A) HIT family hydrolase